MLNFFVLNYLHEPLLNPDFAVEIYYATNYFKHGNGFIVFGILITKSNVWVKNP